MQKIKCGVLCCIFATATISQILASPPVGFNKIKIKGKTGFANQTTFVSIGLSRPGVGQYVVNGHSLSNEGCSTLFFEASPFSLDQFNQVSSPHYVQIANGSNVGTTSEIIDTGDGYLSLSDNIQDVIVPGETRIKVVPYWTLSSAFPMAAGLGSGLSSASANNLTLLSPSGATEVYFFHSASSQWRRGPTDASNVKIPPGTGIMTTRKRPGDVNITMSGEVVTIPVEVTVRSSVATQTSTMLGNPFPDPLNPLRSVGLYTGDSQTGLSGGLSPASAANLVVCDPMTGTPRAHYYHSPSGKWRTGLDAASEKPSRPGHHLSSPESSRDLLSAGSSSNRRSV